MIFISCWSGFAFIMYHGARTCPPYRLTTNSYQLGCKWTRHTVNSSLGELVTKLNLSQWSRHRVKSSHGELVTGAQKRDSELVTRANASIRLNSHSCIVSIGASTFYTLGVYSSPFITLFPSLPSSSLPSISTCLPSVSFPFPPFP